MTSLYRNVFWFAKGMKEYSRNGFRTACRSFNLPDLDVDCSGKVFMVTGATGTLGKVVAIQLAEKGGTVHLVCKSEEKADALKKSILDITENEETVVVHILDLSDPQEVFNFAKSFVKSHGILHVLINCASTITHDREIGESGLEKMFATNTLGVHILIKSLLPVLNQSCEPRVVLVTCGSLLMQRLEPVDLQFESMFPFDGMAAFMQTKRHQAVMVEHYAEANPGIYFSAMHPGWLESQGVREVAPKLLRKFPVPCRTVEEAADTILWLAISRAALKHSSGMFFQDRRTTCPHLPFGKTKTSLDDEKFFMQNLEDFVKKLELS
ncbi:unnamed protein product [Ixodes hexagonus]